MAKRGAGISGKMIVSSTVLLVLVIGLLGALTRTQGGRLVDEFARHRQVVRGHVQRASLALEQCGGRSSGTDALRALDAELAKQAAISEQELGAGLRNVVLVGVILVVAGVLLNMFQRSRIVGPVRTLMLQASRIADGDLSARVEVTTRDEVGVLGERFNQMADHVVSLTQDRVAKVLMEKELEVGSAVQSTIVPDCAEVDLEGISLAGYFKPITQCAGDWWDYCRLADGRVLVIIGDVTGHGVASAMITAAAKGAATAVIDLAGAEIQLPALLKAMNATIHGVAKGRFIMTCFASIYDPATHTLEYANAGHEFPYLVQGTKLTPLVARGNRLGDVADSDFEVCTATVERGATIVWYTDGIIEGADASGEKYGARRFRKQVEEYSDRYAAQARDQILARALEFYGDVPPDDDITLVVARVG